MTREATSLPFGGQWKSACSGETFISTNPAHTSEIIGQHQKSEREDLEGAVAVAAEAQPAWTATPAPTRGEILYHADQILGQRQEELAELMTREMGKILKETRGDVQVAIDGAKFMASKARHAEGETVPSALPDKMEGKNGTWKRGGPLASTCSPNTPSSVISPPQRAIR